ncbi:DMT family transporter [Candidatus Formimonas warabiya]|uniref:EamA domain-containing protein n=1 Tax=Formimonas warabiya TaxID=1761012 RepID=A0A3G1KPB3_FORW1|nr:DMT family transporter [Candidatus Formimonas warabiya]ATW24304.1 hypothetical protein DCMF_05425 [Candidatus Formimonas warabiya]
MMIKNEEIRFYVMGPIQMIFSSVSFAFMSYFAKLASYDVPSTEVSFFRLALGVFVTLVLVAQGRVKLMTENFKLLFVRGIFGGIAVLLFFLALEKGTMTNSVVLQNTYPIFAALLSLYFLKEKVSLRLAFFLMLTFLGIIVLIRPEIGSIRLGDIFALISGLLGGLAVTAVRELRQKNESVWTIFFYFCVFGALISLLLAIPYWQWPHTRGWALILSTGVLGFIGQVTMTSSYKYCSTAVGGILSMSSSVFSFMIGFLLLGELVRVWDLIGVFLIIVGNVMVVVYDGDSPSQHQEMQKQFF